MEAKIADAGAGVVGLGVASQEACGAGELKLDICDGEGQALRGLGGVDG